MSSEAIPIEMIQLCINTLASDEITPEEQALGCFTQKKLEKLLIWEEWKAQKKRHINQFNH